MALLRLSGYPSSVEVALTVAGINTAGTGTASDIKYATPGGATSTVPTLWGDIEIGSVLSADSLDVGNWTLDSATVSPLTPDGTFVDPQEVTAAVFWNRVNAPGVVALTSGTGYHIAAMVKIGTTQQCRLVLRRPSTGLESRLVVLSFNPASTTLATDAGTLASVTIDLLDDGYLRVSAVFTPNASGDYTFGVGPSAVGTVNVYGGGVATQAGSPPGPEPDGVPAQMTEDQFEVIDAGTDGSTLIVRITGLPDDSGSPLLTLGYRVNAGTARTFAAVATGDYQITVPSETLASITVHASNALGPGADSVAETATPTIATTPAIGAADALSYANAIYAGKAALVPSTGQVILIGATAISATPETESYINGIRLFNGDGSQWHCRRWGDLQYVPNGAHDDLNADEFDDVDVAWRDSDDGGDQTFTLRVYGSQMTGDDLARGVTVSTSMTLTDTVAEDAVLEVAFTAGASACVPSLGGVAGSSCPAGKRDVQYIRAPASGSAALTFSTLPVAPVYARVVNTPGDAASIRRLIASRSGTTLSLDWRTMPRSGLPDTTGWTEAGGTPASPEVRDRNAGATGFQISTGYVEWKRFSASATQSVFVHDFRITGANSVVKARGGFSNLLIYDGEGYGPIWASSSFPTQGNFVNPLENTSAWPDAGNFWCYDTVFDMNLSSGNNESIDGDAYIRNMNINLSFMNGDWRDTGDAISDMKGRAQFHAMTYGQSPRAIRAWHHPTTYGRCRLDGPYSQAVVNLSERGAIVALWMVDQPGGARVRDQADVPKSLGLGAFGYVADARQTIVMRSKPAFSTACDYAATDFEFEQSLDGGASWSALTVERTGPNDCWGATRRTVTGVSTSITHVRARALWGAKVGAWTTAAVTT